MKNITLTLNDDQNNIVTIAAPVTSKSWKQLGVSPIVGAYADQITLLVNASASIREARLKLRTQIEADLKAKKITAQEIEEALKLAGFDDAALSRTLRGYGIERKAGDSVKSARGQRSRKIKAAAQKEAREFLARYADKADAIAIAREIAAILRAK
jgi:hypothetical protein